MIKQIKIKKHRLPTVLFKFLEALGWWRRRAHAGCHHTRCWYTETVAGDQKLYSEQGFNYYANLEVTSYSYVANTHGGYYAIAKEQGAFAAVYCDPIWCAEGNYLRKGKYSIGGFGRCVGISQSNRYRNYQSKICKPACSRLLIYDATGDGLIGRKTTGYGLAHSKSTCGKFTTGPSSYCGIPRPAFHLEAAIIDFIYYYAFNTGRWWTSFRRALAWSDHLLLLGYSFFSHNLLPPPNKIFTYSSGI
jgi:hypothetical protein